jgi:hypothetical protein
MNSIILKAAILFFISADALAAAPTKTKPLCSITATVPDENGTERVAFRIYCDSEKCVMAVTGLTTVTYRGERPNAGSCLDMGSRIRKGGMQ